MLEYSPGIVLAWQVAAVEAKAAQQEFIEREHLFMGAMKLLEIPAEAIPDELGNTDLLTSTAPRLAAASGSSSERENATGGIKI